jgi:hypothetical protein
LSDLDARASDAFRTVRWPQYVSRHGCIFEIFWQGAKATLLRELHKAIEEIWSDLPDPGALKKAHT